MTRSLSGARCVNSHCQTDCACRCCCCCARKLNSADAKAVPPEVEPAGLGPAAVEPGAQRYVPGGPGAHGRHKERPGHDAHRRRAPRRDLCGHSGEAHRHLQLLRLPAVFADRRRNRGVHCCVMCCGDTMCPGVVGKFALSGIVQSARGFHSAGQELSSGQPCDPVGPQ
jgi:hypothetical protein